VKRRFVVQRHDVREGEVHWDLMVERSPGDMLATWKLAGPLPSAKGESVPGERSFDHRAAYLEHEGEISGGRGRVAIVARGEAEDLEGVPTSERWVVRLGEGRFLVERSGETVRVTRR
jgi:hypothetical protein